MAFQPACSSVSSVRRRNLAQDRFSKRNKRAFPSDSIASQDDQALEDNNAALDERLWRKLPEEILDMVLSRLPFAARCRFRCVCRSWKEVPSFAPPCTIVSRMGDPNAKFYCNSEKKWFTLPSNKHVPLGWSWVVVDVDAGLVCYQGELDGWYWTWVCNPLDPSMSRLIEPRYPRRDPLLVKPNPPQTKLLVDRGKKTFKVIVLLDELSWTAVYDSTTSCWRVHDDSLFYRLIEFFAWKNGVYAYNPKWTLRLNITYHKERLAAAFNTELGNWTDIEAEAPFEFRFPTDHFFLSYNKQLLLVLFSYRKRPLPYFSVWKLLDKDEGPITTMHSACSKWEKWGKICIDSKRVARYLAGHRLARACYGGEYILFTFVDDKVGEDGTVRHKCMRYSFPTKSWSVVPGPGGGGWGENFKMYTWEPSLGVNPRFQMDKQSVEDYEEK